MDLLGWGAYSKIEKHHALSGNRSVKFLWEPPRAGWVMACYTNSHSRARTPLRDLTNLIWFLFWPDKYIFGDFTFIKAVFRILLRGSVRTAASIISSSILLYVLYTFCNLRSNWGYTSVNWCRLVMLQIFGFTGVDATYSLILRLSVTHSWIYRR